MLFSLITATNSIIATNDKIVTSVYRSNLCFLRTKPIIIDTIAERAITSRTFNTAFFACISGRTIFLFESK